LNERRSGVLRIALSAMLLSLLAALCFQCATTKSLTREEADYLMAIRRSPLTFQLPKAQADDAWGRAQSFIGKYSSMKLQVVTEFVLQTYNPSDYKYGYYVTKTPMGENVEFSIQCLTAGFFADQNAAERNAYILAWYIKTGELPYPHLIVQFGA